MPLRVDAIPRPTLRLVRDGMLFVALPALVFLTFLIDRYHASSLGIDLEQTFLSAARAIADGDSPYPAYGYPPLVAFAVQTGNFTILLLLDAAVCWHARDRWRVSSVAGGLAVAATILRWPLTAWLLPVLMVVGTGTGNGTPWQTVGVLGVAARTLVFALAPRANSRPVESTSGPGPPLSTTSTSSQRSWSAGGITDVDQ
jgi:hypothetical protein